jgi:hypothetical protein
MVGAQSEEELEQLAQKLQNPLASISALPIQNNFLFQSSQNEELGYGLSFQPIFSTTHKNFNLVHRAVFGIGYAPGIVQGLGLLPTGAPDDGRVDGIWGLSDLNYSFYYTPKEAGKVAWGLGPSITLPTATDNRLGSGKWSAGVSAVVVYQVGKWTIDLVVRQTWSFAGDSERDDISQMVLNPLIAYNIDNGWAISTFPSISANWNFESNKWTVPVGGGVSKLLFHGKLPVSYVIQYYYYAARPDLAPTGELRLGATLVFAK